MGSFWNIRSSACNLGINGQASARKASNAVKTVPTSNIESNDNTISFLKRGNGISNLFHYPKRFVSKYCTGCATVLPSYICRSLPQIAVEVSLIIASLGSSILERVLKLFNA